MTKRINPILIFVIMLLVPAIVFAGTSNKFSVAKAVTKADNVVVVPLSISNNVELSGLDIPLQYSEGVRLVEVDFEGTRVDYFDFKVARIDEENRTVVIGLLPQFSTVKKPKLAIGEGVVANLVFEIDDPAAGEISLEAVELENPKHSLSFVYNENGSGTPIKVEHPEFSTASVSFSGVGDNLPNTFALNQNYPNPFNPTTILSFDLPVASRVELSVYNVLGQQVTTLVNSEMEAGRHQVEFDGSLFASGIYFYRITADNFTETKKMVMLK